MKKLILIGAGGHAKSVADSINKSEYELCGFIDSNKKGMHMGSVSYTHLTLPTICSV